MTGMVEDAEQLSAQRYEDIRNTVASSSISELD